MKQYDVAVLYTDGSHTTAPVGTGAGIHGYLYNKKDFTSEKGYYVPGINEAVTATSYERVSGLTELPEMPEGTVEWVNAIIPIPISTAQVGELVGFLSVFEEAAEFQAKKYYIIVDSQYLMNSWNLWVEGWEKRGWLRADGTPVGNLQFMKPMLALKRQLQKEGRDVTFVKIKGHSGRYGNERADVNAKKASAMCATNDQVEFKAHWFTDEATKVESEEDTPVLPKGEMVGQNLSLLPAISTQKYHYLLVNEPHPVVDIKGSPWYFLLSGNHAKSKEDIVLVGKSIPDAMFSVVFSKTPWDNLYTIANAHANAAWDGVAVLKQYDPMALISGEFLRRKKFVDGTKEGLPLAKMTFSEDRNTWFYEDLAISRILRPALLSYRALSYRDELADMLKSCVVKDNSVVLNDITDMLYDEAGKPRKDFYRAVDRSFNVDVKIPGSEQTIPVILSRGIDVPQRSDLNRIKEPTGRFYVACWRPQPRYVRYAVIYIGEAYHGLWIGYFSAKRILPDDIK